MKSTSHLSDMVYESNCTVLTKEQVEEKMKGMKPISYRWLKNKIKRHIPQLYEALSLDFYNPYDYKCGRTKHYYILVHSAIEYFIRK